jgi:hypothetical protein
MSWAEMPYSAGSVFHDKLRTALVAADFDRLVGI